MTKITIRDLHMKTGEWVRKAADAGGIIVSDRGQPVAKLLAFSGSDQGIPFGRRPLLKGFATMPRINHDSTRYLSQDRSRA